MLLAAAVAGSASISLRKVRSKTCLGTVGWYAPRNVAVADDVVVVVVAGDVAGGTAEGVCQG